MDPVTVGMNKQLTYIYLARIISNISEHRSNMYLGHVNAPAGKRQEEEIDETLVSIHARIEPHGEVESKTAEAECIFGTRACWHLLLLLLFSAVFPIIGFRSKREK